MDNVLLAAGRIEPGSALQILISTGLVLAGIVFGVLFARSKIKTEKCLLVCGIILMATEVVKEVDLYRICGSYSWSDFPFQLCSIPMYFCVLYYFSRRRWMEQFVMVYSLIGGAASFLVPEGSYLEDMLLTVHSLFWHMMLLMIGVFLAFRQKKEDMKIRNFIPVGVTYLVLACLAVLFNSIFYRISNGTMNMFFLGPGWPNVIILDSIYTNSGWIPATLGMIGVSEAAGFVVFGLISLVRRHGNMVQYNTGNKAGR